VALTGHILMAVQHDLRGKRRMTGHLDRDVPPVGIQDMERVMLNECTLGFEIANYSLGGFLDLPYRGRGTSNQDKKKSTNAWMFSQILSGDLMFAFFTAALYDGNPMCLCIRSQAPCKASSHPHQVCVVQSVISTIMQGSPPRTKSAWRITQRKIAVQYDSVYAIIAAAQQIAIVIAQLISCHKADVTR